MLKIFSTQLTGVYKKIIDQEEFTMEDGARLLCQAVVSEGTLYLQGFGEMQGILHEAIDGAEPLAFVKPFVNISDITPADRVLVFTRFADDLKAVSLAKELQARDISFVAVSAIQKDGTNELAELADVHIDTKLTRALLPDESGTRFGFPSLMAALFAYHGLKFNIEEIIKEYNEE
ncbi:putative phosphosugar-binding protein [Peribacillus deserti]|uniref:Phosphosugar-binding protein n=1 Tax=Peribacillus deserti TaxID=673318 RepID=A0ABS2QCE8_9BACI|nr:DUF2529 domain-containing protein [Peribacillus deserti]MBM7690655.1 putative phosphosugar-binding protein [Peribacillus deserti]